MKSVLVVDDDVAIAEVLASILGGAGYEVILASNGKRALACLEKSTPQLIMTEFMMPVLGGAALIAAVIGNPTLRDIPVVVMTAVSESTVAASGHGYTGFLRKPFKIRDAVGLVEKLIGPGRKFPRKI